MRDSGVYEAGIVNQRRWSVSQFAIGRAGYFSSAFLARPFVRWFCDRSTDERFRATAEESGQSEIVIGIVAGFLAGKIMRGKGYGVLMDLLLGLVGAVVGGFVFSLLGLHAYGLVGQLVIATAGAVMLIWLVRRL
jgi:uncharacterized membrane protein YeaQ/YmgE (transglycosylase-associated protein family)